MVTLFAKKTASDTIQVSSFPSAKAAGELCQFGSLVGFSTLKTEAGAMGSVNVGKQIAVFQAANYFGTPAIGTDVYIASDGTLTVTATGNILLGTIVAIGSGTVDIAITG